MEQGTKNGLGQRPDGRENRESCPEIAGRREVFEKKGGQKKKKKRPDVNRNKGAANKNQGVSWFLKHVEEGKFGKRLVETDFSKSGGIGTRAHVRTPLIWKGK